MDDVPKADRPRVLAGITVKVPTGCGNMYVQLNWCQGRLFEIFATLGKTGGCPSCLSEGVTRSITAGLRSGVPYKEYVKQLSALRCPTPHPFPKEEAVSSCPDAISMTLRRYGGMPVDDVLALVREALTGETIKSEVDEEQREAEVAMEKLRQEREDAGLYDD